MESSLEIKNSKKYEENENKYNYIPISVDKDEPQENNLNRKNTQIF